MVIPVWLVKFRSIMGKIADFFIAGRAAGAWSQKNGPDVGPKK